MSRDTTIQYLNALDSAQAQLDTHLQPLFKKWMTLQAKIDQISSHELDLRYVYEEHTEHGVCFFHEGSSDWNSYRQTIPWEFLDNPVLYASQALRENEERLERAKQQKIDVAKGTINRLTRQLQEAKATLAHLDTEEKAD